MNTQIPSAPAELEKDGYAIYESVLDDGLIDELIADLPRAYEEAREVQKRNGVAGLTGDTVNHLLTYGGSFVRLLDHDLLDEEITAYFGGPYILNAIGGIINRRRTDAYLSRVHRDIRSYTSEPLMLNMIIMLDDFTSENGATWIMPGGHRIPEKPTDEEFFAVAKQLLGPRGSIALWNANAWHSAGENRTDEPRRALSLLYTKPFIKQQMDYPRVLGYDFLERASERLRQIVGYNARTPANLDEWYQPPENRFYKSDQG